MASFWTISLNFIMAIGGYRRFARLIKTRTLKGGGSQDEALEGRLQEYC
jgi:hypothetical protein